MLSLYNAAYLRTHGDKVLDEAYSFTKKWLVSELEHLESSSTKDVRSALDTPLFRRVGILEARSYITSYEKEATRNEAMLELAKLNFNLLQHRFCEELKEVTL
jgi:(S)-beta-macrocarpene synthase